MPAQLQTRHVIDLSSREFKEAKRTFTLDRAAIDKANRTVALSFASEEPVDRRYGREILDITTEACDLTRLRNGGAVLCNHDTECQVGVVMQPEIDPATRKARCMVKFSRSQEGEDIFQDVIDGIRTLVSVGYIVRKMELASVDGGVETHRVTDWQPYEVSIVSVPADITVGVGRSQEAAGKTRAKTNQPIPKMSAEPITATPNAAELERASTETLATERNRTKAIRTASEHLFKSHAGYSDAIRSLANRAIDEGLDENQFNAEAIKIFSTGRATPAAREVQAGATLGLTGKEQKRFSLMKAIREQAEGRGVTGFEKECSDQLATNLQRAPQGFFVPDEIIKGRRGERSGLLATSAVDGGFTISEEQLESEFVTYLRNMAKVMGLGARLITGLRGNITIPRQLTGAAAYWVAEGASITQSSATFGQITATPRRVGTSVPYSKQFLAQSSLSAEAFVRDDSQQAIAVDLDRVAISGSGIGEPLGILNLASGDRSTSVSFGAAATWAKYVDFWTQVATNNALLGNPKYLTTPASSAKAQTIAKFSNTSEPIWYQGKIGVFDADWSNQFPTAGTLNQVIFGDFSQVLYLEWAGYDVVVDPYTGKKEGTIEITIQRLIDMVIRRGKSFSISSDSGAQ